MTIYGKVLRIFDERSLLVNIGSREGLKRGDSVVVIERGGEVKDPESGESLGDLELVKARLTAVDVQEKMSVLETERVKAAGGDMPLSSRMVKDSVKQEQDPGLMQVAAGELSGLPSIRPVAVGDTVRANI